MLDPEPAARRSHAARAALAAARRRALVRRPAGRLPRPCDVRADVRSGIALARRPCRRDRDPAGANGARRLLAGRGHGAFARTRSGPAAARGDRRALRVHPRRRGLRGRSLAAASRPSRSGTAASTRSSRWSSGGARGRSSRRPARTCSTASRRSRTRSTPGSSRSSRAGCGPRSTALRSGTGDERERRGVLPALPAGGRADREALVRNDRPGAPARPAALHRAPAGDPPDLRPRRSRSGCGSSRPRAW